LVVPPLCRWGSIVVSFSENSSCRKGLKQVGSNGSLALTPVCFQRAKPAILANEKVSYHSAFSSLFLRKEDRGVAAWRGAINFTPDSRPSSLTGMAGIEQGGKNDYHARNQVRPQAGAA
jgi:hypothetical protein